MAKTKLKRMDRFELLELIYDMRKANLELTQRCEEAEQKIKDLQIEADQRVEAVREEYVRQLDELRMQGSAKELQKRMNMIEEQLIAFQNLTGKQSPPEAPAQEAPQPELLDAFEDLAQSPGDAPEEEKPQAPDASGEGEE